MLGSLRKFSGSIYAKILLGIVVVPFVFLGFGGSFLAGNKNTILTIDKEKYPIQDFRFYISRATSNNQKISSNQIDGMLYTYIGDKLVEKEIEYFQINLSDESLSKLIKHQKDFKRDGKFSRMEYEKFLLKQNISSVLFEEQLKKHEKKKQFVEFIRGGILPSEFLVNTSYDKINQKRNIQVINLNNIFKLKLNFTDNEIQEYYQKNQNNFAEIYKHVNVLELTPKKLIGLEEFNNSFYNKIDDIDELILESANLEFIIQKFNLEPSKTFVFNDLGNDINSKKINTLPDVLIKKVFDLNATETSVLIENKNKFFIFEIIKVENMEKGIKNEAIRKKVISGLKTNFKRKSISEIISKVNSGNFNKKEFDKFSNEKKSPSKLISLSNVNENSIFKGDLLNQIYASPEKKVIVVYDINLEDIFLVYIEKIEHVKIDEKSKEYKKYVNLSKNEITNNLFNTYDRYIKKRYKIDINYEALKTIKNSFN